MLANYNMEEPKNRYLKGMVDKLSRKEVVCTLALREKAASLSWSLEVTSRARSGLSSGSTPPSPRTAQQSLPRMVGTLDCGAREEQEEEEEGEGAAAATQVSSGRGFQVGTICVLTEVTVPCQTLL